MGNQATNHQYYQNNKWTPPSGGTINPQGQYTLQHSKVQAPIMIEKPYHMSNIKTKQTPLQEKIAISRFGSQIQNGNLAVRNSTVSNNIQPIFIPELNAIKGSALGSQTNINSQKQLSEVKILIKPEYGKSGSIFEKHPQKYPNNFSFDTLIEKVDEIRVSLRHYQSKMVDSLIPMFQQDIKNMNEKIEGQRQMKLKDKNKVLYLLKQKKHYHKLCLKFKDFDQKIKTVLLQFRKKDSIHQIQQQELIAGFQLKNLVQSLIQSIQKDLPHRGWKQSIDKPISKYYLSVVTSAIQDHEIMSQYNQIQLSLTNPHVLQQIMNEEMMYSTTRRIGGQTTQQTAKKLIQGPAHYNDPVQMMRGTKYPSPRMDS